MTSLRHTLRACATRTTPILFLAVLALAGVPDLQAQVRPDSARTAAGTMQPPMEAQYEDMVGMAPMVGQMMQVMMRSILQTLALPESTELLATFTRNYFDALIAKGFSRDEALRIVMAHGIPAMPTGR